MSEKTREVKKKFQIQCILKVCMVKLSMNISFPAQWWDAWEYHVKSTWHWITSRGKILFLRRAPNWVTLCSPSSTITVYKHFIAILLVSDTAELDHSWERRGAQKTNRKLPLFTAWKLNRTAGPGRSHSGIENIICNVLKFSKNLIFMQIHQTWAEAGVPRSWSLLNFRSWSRSLDSFKVRSRTWSLGYKALVTKPGYL